MKTSLQGATLLTGLLFAHACLAVPIASDSFATSAGEDGYVASSTIRGQNPTAGASGFVGPWGNCCTSAMVPLPGGLTHDLTTGATFDGQLVSFGSDGSVGGGNARNLGRTIDYTPTDGTYYMSVLLEKAAFTNRGDLLAGLSPSQDAEESISTVTGTYIGFIDGGIEFFSGPGPSLTTLLSAGEMNIGETYFALLQFDYTTSGSDTVTATIFDGSSEEVESRSFPELDLDGSLGRFSVLTQDFGPVPVVDEWRFGTELSDVMVQAVFAGDMNGDGEVNFGDLSPFALGLTDIPAYEATYPDVDRVAAGDVNMDDAFNFGDLTPFVALLTGGSASGSAIPEPSTAIMAAFAAVGFLACGRRRIARG